jgi:hypothetical protein
MSTIWQVGPLVVQIDRNGGQLMITLGAAGAVAMAASLLVRFALPEVLRHARQIQLLRNQHAQLVLQEGNRHTEAMFLLANIIRSNVFNATANDCVADSGRVKRPVGPDSAPIRP